MEKSPRFPLFNVLCFWCGANLSAWPKLKRPIFASFLPLSSLFSFLFSSPLSLWVKGLLKTYFKRFSSASVSSIQLPTQQHCSQSLPYSYSEVHLIFLLFSNVITVKHFVFHIALLRPLTASHLEWCCGVCVYGRGVDGRWIHTDLDGWQWSQCPVEDRNTVLARGLAAV